MTKQKDSAKRRLAGDTAREANSDEVKGLRNRAAQLKEALAERRQLYYQEKAA